MWIGDVWSLVVYIHIHMVPLSMYSMSHIISSTERSAKPCMSLCQNMTAAYLSFFKYLGPPGEISLTECHNGKARGRTQKLASSVRNPAMDTRLSGDVGVQAR